MICPDYSFPQYLIFSSQVPTLLYYSHIPAMILSLGMGFFVYFKDRYSLANKLLLSMGITFFVWTFLDLIVWTNNNSEVIMFVWTFFCIFTAILSLLCFYFVYTFINKSDLSFKIKMIMGLLVLPIIFFAPTKYNIYNFDLGLCGVINEGSYYVNYSYGIGFLMFFSILFLIILKYRKAEEVMKKQIAWLGIGIELFLLSFFTTGYIAGLILENSYSIEFYGLFAMTFFMGALMYIIVKFKAFEIKLLGAQALVVAQFIMIASMFTFAAGTTSRILIGVTLLGTAIMGWNLIRSVKLEVQRKEELQMMSDKLANANDQLRKLDNSKSEFISIASHQLRTPITAIKGFLSLVLEGSYGKITPSQQDALNKAYTSNERLLTLVEDLLNISRIESGRMEFKFGPTKIEDVCQEVVDTLMIKARDRKLYLDYKKSEFAIPELVIDATKVREVISNMVDNALKYTEKGGVTMRVERVVDKVRVTVSDTGIGIPLTELPYLFSKFSRGKDVARLNTGGTGLGLYVGQMMIEQNGGKIWAESEGAGKGSRFIIELPLKQDEELLKRWGSA